MRKPIPIMELQRKAYQRMTNPNQLVATGSKIIFRSVKPEKATESGIILKGIDSTAAYGQVLSVGPDAKSGVTAGDHVLPDWRHVMDFKFGDAEYSMVDDGHLMAVIQ